MKDSQASLTALLVSFAVALLWCEDEDYFSTFPWSSSSPKTCILMAELVRSISRSNDLPFYLRAIPLFVLNNAYTTRIFRCLCIFCLGRAPEGLWFRKFYIEDKVREFLSRQMGNNQSDDNKSDRRKNIQVLVLAAGYDTLAMKLASEYPNIGFFELDHPATGNVKIKSLKRMIQNGCTTLGTEVNPFPENLSYYHADLAKTSAQEALAMSPVIKGAKATFQFRVPTIVVVEGLTMYLTEEQVCTIFNSISDTIGVEGSCTVFNFFEFDENGRPVTPSMKKYPKFRPFSFIKNFTRASDEVLKWGIDPENLSDFFSDTNWDLVPIPGGEGKGSASSLGIEFISMANWVNKQESKKEL